MTPLEFFEKNPMSSLALVIFSSFLVFVFLLYQKKRQREQSIKAIIFQIFIFIILLFLFFDIFFTYGNTQLTIFKSVTFLLMLFFGRLIVRGINYEYQAKENMRRFTEELALANQRLREIDIEKSEFVSIATHQLRTPLTIIKGYASMILEGTFGKVTDPKQIEIIGKISEASERLVAMIEDFLNLSRIERGEISYHLERVDILILIKKVVEEFRASIEGARAPIEIQADDAEEYVVLADELKLRQVFSNLIDNAVKYSPQGSLVFITLNKQNATITVSVKDKGIGVSEDVIPKLFKKFSRSDITSKLHKEGRGLGLFIAKQIMMAHGGKIWVESKGKNQGSTFFVVLPEAPLVQTRQELKPFIQDIK